MRPLDADADAELPPAVALPLLLRPRVGARVEAGMNVGTPLLKPRESEVGVGDEPPPVSVLKPELKDTLGGAKETLLPPMTVVVGLPSPSVTVTPESPPVN